MRLKDASIEGLGFLNRDPLKPGVKIKIMIPELDGSRWFEATVARCKYSSAGIYEIGINVDPHSCDTYRSVYDQISEIEASRGTRVNTASALNEWDINFSRRNAELLN
jgi:hypothetical protein